MFESIGAVQVQSYQKADAFDLRGRAGGSIPALVGQNAGSGNRGFGEAFVVALSPESKNFQNTSTTMDGRFQQPAALSERNPGQREETAMDKNGAAAKSALTGEEEMSAEEKREVQELKQRDREVKAHEQAHQSTGGRYTGSASYEYTTGPDGKRYATGGEVPIDVSPAGDDPKATIEKMRVVRRAALAPAQPSSQDRRVASAASQAENQARAELREDRQAEAREAMETTPGPTSLSQGNEIEPESTGPTSTGAMGQKATLSGI